jgi:hypothetical protein
VRVVAHKNPLVLRKARLKDAGQQNAIAKAKREVVLTPSNVERSFRLCGEVPNLIQDLPRQELLLEGWCTGRVGRFRPR